jgi:DNA-binding transcriptional LysR family regulator
MRSLRQLEVFRAIMQGGTITEAARLLGVSQPAVSKILRHTEDQLGMSLFRRLGGRLQPTPEATAIFPEIDQIFHRIELVQRSALTMANPAKGSIMVGTIPTLAATLLPPAIAAFRRALPQTRVQVKILRNQEVIDRVVNHQIDLGIIYSPAEEPAIVAEELYPAEIICTFPSGHPLGEKDEIYPADLVEYDLISISEHSSFGMSIEMAFRAEGVPRRNVVEVSHSLVALELVNRGAGVAVVDPFATMGHIFPKLVFRAFRPRVAINPQIIFSRRHPLSRLQMVFIDHLKRVELSLSV